MEEAACLQLAHRMASLQPSATLAMAARAGAMKASGIDVIDLSVGEPDFPTPEHICEAGKAAITAGKTKYTPAAGIPALREAIAKDYTRRSGLPVTPAHVIVSNGAKHSLHNVFSGCARPFARSVRIFFQLPCYTSNPLLDAVHLHKVLRPLPLLSHLLSMLQQGRAAIAVDRERDRFQSS